MGINRHTTTDLSEFDYMANSGLEEKDRDSVGMLAAVVIVVILTAFQYFGWY
jgi:hypothetical protein